MGRWKVFLSLVLIAAGSCRSRERIEPEVVEARDLVLSGATGELSKERLRILTTAKDVRARAFVSGLKLDASSYGYVAITIDAPVDRELFFLFRTTESPDTIRGVGLPRPAAKTTMVELGARPEWRGPIEGIGVGWTGPVKAPITLGRLTLEPFSARARWLSLWHEWTAFEGLKGYSTNFVIGGSTLVSQRVRLVPAVALVSFLVLAVYWVAARLRSRPFRGGVAVAIVLAGWLLLDLRWQWDLWREARLTEERFAGKSVTEKKLADDDGELFLLAMELKRVLGDSPRVVFLVSRDPEGADRYVALRTRYHLLPHNVNASYRYPPAPSEIASGQYVLVVEPRDDIRYDEDTEQLVWTRGASEEEGRLELELVQAWPSMSLYRRP